MADYKQLCVELVDAIDSGIPTDRMHLSPLMLRARAALAEPEPEYPSDVNNLYIINQVLTDYTSGMVVIAAPSLERCREIFEEEFKGGMNEFDAAVKYNNFKVIEAVNHAEGMVSHVCGGG